MLSVIVGSVICLPVVLVAGVQYPNYSVQHCMENLIKTQTGQIITCFESHQGFWLPQQHPAHILLPVNYTQAFWQYIPYTQSISKGLACVDNCE